MIQPKDTEEMTQLTNRFNQEVNNLSQSEKLEQIPTSTDGGAGLVSTGDGVAFHSGDVKPPLIKLVQPTSADGTPGRFHRLDTEEEFDELVVTGIRIQPVRTKWPADGFSRDRSPECLSRDGIHAVTTFGDGKVPRFPGALCAKCQFFTLTPWRAADGDEICLPGYDVILMDVETFEPYGLRLQGTATKIARILGAKSNFRKSQIRLFAEKVVGARGTWYQLRAKAEGLLTEEILAQAQMVAEEYGTDFSESDR